MSETEKLATIRAILEELEKLRHHLIETDQFNALSNADAGALKRIAAIMGCAYH